MEYLSVPIPDNQTIRKWAARACCFVVVCYVAWLVRIIWVPLGLALILAMVLDPIVDRMEARGWNRTWATAFIFGAFLLIAGGLLALSLPYLMAQGSQMQAQFQRYFPDGSPDGLARSLHKMNVPEGTANIAAKTMGSLEQEWARSTSSVVGYGILFASNLVWVVIIPIVAFYALRDFHLIMAKALLVVPFRNRSVVQTAVVEITAVFGKYLRGLAIVSALNGVATFLLLQALGVPSALLLGALAGLLYSVPYVGAVLTVALTAAVSFLGGGLNLMLAAVGASIFLHQILFDQIVTPRILGGHVGLHPILSIIALLVGNLLLGIVGMILAVPVAACIQIAVLAVLPKLAVPIDLPPPNVESEATLTVEDSESSAKKDASEHMREAVASAVDAIDGQAAPPEEPLNSPLH